MIMNKIEDMNLEEQIGLKRLLALDPSILTPAQKLHLRARRSYLIPVQKFEYCGILYFSRPALAYEINFARRFLLKHSIKFIASLILTIATIWVSRLLGW